MSELFHEFRCKGRGHFGEPCGGLLCYRCVSLQAPELRSRVVSTYAVCLHSKAIKATLRKGLWPAGIPTARNQPTAGMSLCVRGDVETQRDLASPGLVYRHFVSDAAACMETTSTVDARSLMTWANREMGIGRRTAVLLEHPPL
jgi:hypothetical protein